MAGRKIASDAGIAQAAASGVQNVMAEGGGDFSLGESNISGMQEGVQITNQILPDLLRLTQCVMTHASKFPQLAAVIEARDSQVKFD